MTIQLLINGGTGLEGGWSVGSEVASVLLGLRSESLSPMAELHVGTVLESESSLVSDTHIIPVDLADLDDADALFSDLLSRTHLDV